MPRRYTTRNTVLVARSILKRRRGKKKQPIFARSIADELGLDIGAVSRVLHRMEEAGWLEQQSGPRLSNVGGPPVYYALTAAGLRALPKLRHQAAPGNG